MEGKYISLQLLKRFIEWKIGRDFRGVPSISTVELAYMLESDLSSNVVLVDVRKQVEFDVSHLANAIRAENVEELVPQLSEFDRSNSEQKIVLYCSVGYRSARLTRDLMNAGFENVFNLDGSIFQWYNEGRDVFQTEKLVNDVHPYSSFWSFLIKRERQKESSG